MRRVLILLGAAIGCAYGQSTSMGGRTMKGDWDASSAHTTKPAKSGTTLPGACSTGEAFFKTDATGGQNLYLCKPDNTWTQVSGGGGTAATLALVFDGSTLISSETMSAWSCSSGSGASCTTQWTVPAGVAWVRVQAWGGGGGGGGSTAGLRSQPGGSGGGYGEITCQTTPGAAVTIAVGLGGTGLTDGTTSTGNSGGNSSFGPCITVTGGGSVVGGGAGVGWGGRISGQPNIGWYYGMTMRDPNATTCQTSGVGPSASAMDQGGCGGLMVLTSGNAGYAGGSGFGGGGGGGSGGYNNSTYGARGASALGGIGGHGGAWTSGGGLVACSDGSIPGGGGGAAGVETTGGSTHAGCSGGRGEVRVYYVR